MRALRASTGMTVEEVSANLGVTKQYLSQIENGTKSCNMEFFEKVIKVYGFEIEIKPKKNVDTIK